MKIYFYIEFYFLILALIFIFILKIINSEMVFFLASHLANLLIKLV